MPVLKLHWFKLQGSIDLLVDFSVELRHVETQDSIGLDRHAYHCKMSPEFYSILTVALKINQTGPSLS